MAHIIPVVNVDTTLIYFSIYLAHTTNAGECGDPVKVLLQRNVFHEYTPFTKPSIFHNSRLSYSFEMERGGVLDSPMPEACRVIDRNSWSVSQSLHWAQATNCLMSGCVVQGSTGTHAHPGIHTGMIGGVISGPGS